MKKVLLIILMLVVIVLIGVLALQILALKYNSSAPVNKDLTLIPKTFTSSTTSTPNDTGTPPQQIQLTSRLALEQAENVVKEKKISPPEASRLYAYVATAYFETLQATKDTLQALDAAKTITEHMYPSTMPSTSTGRLGLQLSTTSTPPTSSSDIPTPLETYPSKITLLPVFQDLLSREKNDGFYTSTTNIKPPKGANYWKSSTPPITPHAGKWQRWLIPENTTFKIDSPPLPGSKEFDTDIEVIKEMVANRTTDQEKLILVWNGGAGTVTLAGLWQDILWESFKKQLGNKQSSSNLDLKYAYMQKILAQGIADSFMETWNIKFTYWSLRPNMVFSELETFVPNPRTPAYVSEHAVVSRAAAEILSNLFGDQKNSFISQTQEASNTRLWAGVHFKSDNEAGLKLGEQTGKEVKKNIGIFE